MQYKVNWAVGKNLLLATAVTALSACVGNGTSSSSDTNQGTQSSANTVQSSVGTNSSAVTQSSNPSVSSANTMSSAPSSQGSASSSPVYTSGTSGYFRVNPEGRIMKNGQAQPIRCGNWFGLEGQHEADGRAPMELYIGNMWWDGTNRTLAGNMREIKSLGFNTIRLPIAPQTLVKGHPDGRGSLDINAPADKKGNNLKNTYTAYQYDDAYDAMIGFLEEAQKANMNVMIDIHSCSNYVGWRAGRLDSAPPYVDKDRGVDYEFTREDYSCGAAGPGVTVHEYNEQKWLADIRTISLLAKDYRDTVIGIDIFNEPWDYSWDEWATLAEKAYDVIEQNNDDMLIFVQGISGGNRTNAEEPHGDLETNPNWGENFFGFHERPLDIPQDRLVISPHTYGPAVYQQAHFMNIDKDPTCEGLHGEEAGEHGCDMVMEADRLRPGWEEHFGFLRDMGYAVVIGEWGGNRYWPTGGGARPSEAAAWPGLTVGSGENNIDFQWQRLFADYMKDEQIESCYWGINPESADTGGIFEHAYSRDGRSWGLWEEVDDVKMNLLRYVWGM